LPTSPGTEINVTPEIVKPTIPKATRYHGEHLFPVKKVSFLAFLEEKYETHKRSTKKKIITVRIRPVLI